MSWAPELYKKTPMPPPRNAFFIREAVVNLSELESIIRQAQGRIWVLTSLYEQKRIDDVLFEKALIEIEALLKAAVDFEFQLEARKVQFKE